MRTRHLALAAALVLLTAALGACGKRGPLDPPPRAEKSAEANKAAAEDGQVIEEREEAAKDEHEPFILDVLL